MLESGLFAPISMFFIIFIFGRLFPVGKYNQRDWEKLKDNSDEA
jgi:hypothetical protein